MIEVEHHSSGVFVFFFSAIGSLPLVYEVSKKKVVLRAISPYSSLSPLSGDKGEGALARAIP